VITLCCQALHRKLLSKFVFCVCLSSMTSCLLYCTTLSNTCMCKKCVNYLTYCAGTNQNLTTEVVTSKGLCIACFSLVISVLVKVGVYIFRMKPLNYGLQL
jgi:hypothetical protein